MEGNWATLQLPFSEETITPALLCRNLSSILPDIEVFMPTLRYRDKRGEYIYSLFDGYAFVRGEMYRDSDYLRLSNSPYVHKVLTYSSTGPGRALVAYTPDVQIQEMRDKLTALIPSGFEEGDRVHITDGIYRDLDGKILGRDGEDMLVEVYMPMASITKLTAIPQMFLEHIRKDEG